MASWILLTVVAQFLNAGVSLTDKYIVSSKRVSRPIVYAFYVGLFAVLSLFVFLFSWIPIPFENLQIPSITNVSWPTWTLLLTAFLAGFSFLAALVAFFSAFVDADASDVVPVSGSATAVSTLLFSYFLLDSTLPSHFVLGFTVLIIGTVLVSLFRFHWKTLVFSLAAGFGFGLHFVLVKRLFEITHFDNAYLWLNLSITIASFVLLLWPHKEGSSHHEVKKTTFSSYLIIFAKQAVSGVAAFMLLKAIELGNVAVVQALGGLQFVFLLFFAIAFGNATPHYCGENCTPWQKVQKIVSVIVITAGFVLLFI